MSLAGIATKKPDTSPGPMNGAESPARWLREREVAFKTTCERLLEQDRSGVELQGAAAWLLDNYSFVSTQLRQVREALSRDFWKKLRRHIEAGQPRVLEIAREAARAGEVITGESLLASLRSSPHIGDLTLAELWALPPMLKLVCLQCVCAVAESNRLDAPDSEAGVRSAIASLHALDKLSFDGIVEELGIVDAELRRDPAGVYADMDFDTRDAYRAAVEKIAERSPALEVEVATFAVALATAAASQREGDVRRLHVGFYLLGAGRKELLRKARYRPAMSDLVRRVITGSPTFFYLAAGAAVTGLLLFAAHRLLAPAPIWLLALLAIPASQVALAFVNPVVSLIVRPAHLPRLDFSSGIPGRYRSFVVVPTLLTSRSGVDKLLERIEIHYLANRDANLRFGLLTDLGDAGQQTTEHDHIAVYCAEGIRALNKRYGREGSSPFYLFHRERVWNPSEQAWMGHERKRGKLEDFNDLLLGKRDAFALKEGDLGGLAGTRFVITLDTDTQIRREGARLLIGILAHPLHQPVFDKNGIVRHGYALLQPRVGISMTSAMSSRFAQMMSGQTGLDPYTKAVSDLYQDLFGHAVYTGKGIYDVAAFARATEGRFPENTLLSHDLIEGEHARVGLVSDVEVIDDYPTSYTAFSKRKHRWVRGDWQIAAWALPWAPDANWKWSRNVIPAVSRWKILDNLRRSLYEVCLVAFVVMGILWSEEPGRVLLVMAAVLALPPLAQLLFSFLRIPPVRFWRAWIREVGWQFGRSLLEALLTLAFLLHQALLMADAIVRTFIRRLLTKRKLLEWETAAQAEDASTGETLGLVTIYLLACPFLATAIGVAAWLADVPSHFGVALCLTLWAAAPLTAEFVSRRRTPSSASADGADTAFLRDVSLQTWRYFVDFASPEHGWLVPDNVQEDPFAIAHRASPTNMGLQLCAYVAAHEFGYLTARELATQFEGLCSTLQRLDRFRGHFFNWYDTRELQPLSPRYVSSVDSGNLAACLLIAKQSCHAVLKEPAVSPNMLEGLRDYCLRLRNTLPPAARTASLMKALTALRDQLSYQPDGLFAWEGLLSEFARGCGRLREKVEWLCDHWEGRDRDTLDDTRYWLQALLERTDANLAYLRELAPWLAENLAPEMRIVASDPAMADLMGALNCVPTVGQVAAHLQKGENLIRAQLDANLIRTRTRETSRPV